MYTVTFKQNRYGLTEVYKCATEAEAKRVADALVLLDNHGIPHLEVTVNVSTYQPQMMIEAKASETSAS